MKNNRSILFAINGYGLGNSSRCLPLIQELKVRGYTIYLASSENGISFYKSRGLVEKTFELQQAKYSIRDKGEINTLETILNFKTIAKIYLENSRKITNLALTLRISALVLDSQYILPLPKQSNIKVCSINNARDALVDFFSYGTASYSSFAQLFAVETLDFIYQKVVPDKILRPQIPDVRSIDKKKSLLCRRELKPKVPTSLKKIVVLTSGSGISIPLINIFPVLKHYAIDVIGIDGNNCKNITYHRKLFDNLCLLEQADLLIINAGFSSISEALALKKPALVMPIPGHHEQYCNAKRYEGFGAGEVVYNAKNLKPALERLITNYPKYLENCRSLPQYKNAYSSFCQSIEDLLN